MSPVGLQCLTSQGRGLFNAPRLFMMGLVHHRKQGIFWAEPCAKKKLSNKVQTSKKPRVAVLGAGIGGLMAVKSCLEENLEPICFEQDDQIGGIWYYSESLRSNQGAASYKNLVSNSSKEFMCLSDYPFPDDAPLFLPCKYYHQYIFDIAKTFDLNQYIHLNTSVLKVTPAAHFKQSGCWKVDVRKSGSNEVISHEVDGVVVSTGCFKQAYIPDITGMDTYTGEFLHMIKYRDSEIFRNKTVVIIGNQSSAGDACGDAGRLAKQVYWSHGEGAWIESRFSPGGLPADLLQTRKTLKLSRKVLGEWKKQSCESLLNHSQYGIGHTKNPTAGGPTMKNDDLVFMLASGLVIAKPNITKIEGSKVVFADGSIVEADMILAATGFMPDYSFVDCPQIQGTSVKNMQLYKYTFPILDGPVTIGLIGTITLMMGSLVPAMELQSRWIARVLAGKCSLPPVHTMKRYLKQEMDFFDRECGGKIQKYTVPFQEEIAEEIGVKPSYWKLLWDTWDLALLKAVFKGPVFPVHYRLQGPGSYLGAREECMKALYRAYHMQSFESKCK